MGTVAEVGGVDQMFSGEAARVVADADAGPRLPTPWGSDRGPAGSLCALDMATPVAGRDSTQSTNALLDRDGERGRDLARGYFC